MSISYNWSGCPQVRPCALRMLWCQTFGPNPQRRSSEVAILIGLEWMKSIEQHPDISTPDSKGHRERWGGFLLSGMWWRSRAASSFSESHVHRNCKVKWTASSQSALSWFLKINRLKKKPNVLGCQKRVKIVKLKKSLTQPILLKVSCIFTLLQILGGYVNSLKSFLSFPSKLPIIPTAGPNGGGIVINLWNKFM